MQVHTPNLSEQERVRRDNLLKIRDMGIDPYPAEAFPVTHRSADLLKGFDAQPEAFAEVALAGRMMAQRIMGKAAFAVIQDGAGRIQCYIARDEIAPGEDKALYNELFKKYLDLGDWIGVRGHVFRTQTGEISIHVRELRLLAKSLRPLRYRQRYVDLVVNPEVRETFRQRARLVTELRRFLDERGYVEVETPVLQPLYGGAAARPFTTHHNALDMRLYLRIADELYLKRLIVGGFEGVYEISKDFRNEGLSASTTRSSPCSSSTWPTRTTAWMMELVEEMIETACRALHGRAEVEVTGPDGRHTISFARPWRRSRSSRRSRSGPAATSTGSPARRSPPPRNRRSARGR
jgi:lysyl-tRNA synthetase, class II